MKQKFLIYSLEHGAWWAPNSNGYVRNRSKAGIYSYKEAKRIVDDSCAMTPDNEPPNEAMVPAIIIKP